MVIHSDKFSDKGKKVDLFPQWKPQQGVVEEPEEVEEYLSVREDGREEEVQIPDDRDAEIELNQVRAL